jgi:hypothetical protein
MHMMWCEMFLHLQLMMCHWHENYHNERIPQVQDPKTNCTKNMLKLKFNQTWKITKDKPGSL